MEAEQSRIVGAKLNTRKFDCVEVFGDLDSNCQMTNAIRWENRDVQQAWRLQRKHRSFKGGYAFSDVMNSLTSLIVKYTTPWPRKLP
ncbi:MAG: hypothetical protein E5X63_10925 [Mesorhizobium sp.]|nr:MAG: hypothetical protein E5X63_10925 [Mesorhizobium sp.]